MKNTILLFTLIIASYSVFAQKGQDVFWEKLHSYCGKSFEGKITSSGKNEGFDGKRLIMHVKSCSENELKIPFFVGDDRSRTWVLTKSHEGILLKHDHRHENGSPEEQTMYGGLATNSGNDTMQFFPADQETCDLLDFACFNVWWMTVNETSFTYNLRRIGTDRLFTVTFDLTKTVENPEHPWGWEEN